ncbi:XrtB/PEP-CTERM-associated transcriptional regulator EpsA [Ramlibacter rhizophilus]|uniref:Helix-turn-helix transcriptional regulator n=1 Tax=Ramlibacter rhizophilus TaxID=1781167 RepID=A0A4Z0BPK2_9BURK|nr:XrtB/PEP-CTERM-associated transcriptional regulator EpsA [Ramlibacter rhizophilus]TFY99984.1 helix-turn-helix transcriptional regulator [Ramlibacter rhizophilus]
MNDLLDMPVAQSPHAAAFLRVATRGAALSTHADLWRWLRDDVQALLPHELLLVAWGDFQSPEVQVDLVSSLPGLRTHECRPARLMPLVNYLRDCWVAARHGACRVDLRGCAELFGAAAAGWPAGQSLAGMRSAVVHGTRDPRTGAERIFAALSEQAHASEGAPAMLRLLMPFIDLALRAMPAAPSRQQRFERGELDALVGPLGTLSERERQIMVWVAMGKTNPEIGCILRISEFTVKNHMKSIFTKLDVTNRAQAVAKLTRMSGAYA